MAAPDLSHDLIPEVTDDAKAEAENLWVERWLDLLDDAFYSAFAALEADQIAQGNALIQLAAQIGHHLESERLEVLRQRLTSKLQLKQEDYSS